MKEKLDLYNLNICPDCGYEQTNKNKKELDECDSPNLCESYVDVYGDKLIWNNPNWS